MKRRRHFTLKKHNLPVRSPLHTVAVTYMWVDCYGFSFAAFILIVVCMSHVVAYLLDMLSDEVDLFRNWNYNSFVKETEEEKL